MAGQGHEAEDGAERAFEALRAEVAGLRRGLERLDELMRQGQREQAEARAGAPDYSPTLGAMAKELTDARKRLAAIEGKPALGFTVAGFEYEMRTAARAAVVPAGAELQTAAARMDAAAHELADLVGRVRKRDEQRAWVWTAAGCGAMVGALVWLLAAALLPWGAGHWLAARLVGGGQWHAGATLMHEADPEAWNRLMRLYKACPQESSTELCEAALVVRTIPPVGQPLAGQSTPAPEGTKAAPSVLGRGASAASLPRGRDGVGR